MSETRKIIHVDMDAFYASVEQRDDPRLVGKPVVVGGSPDGRGVVAAASYEARRYGVRSAMSARHAIRLCRNLVFVRPDFRKYKAISETLHRIFREVTDIVEPLALDEAYLDVTENKLGEPSATRLARYLKARVRGATGLSSSAGVGPNKFLAKLASGLEKPDGLVVIPPDKIDAYLTGRPVEDLWGVGPATARRLRALGFARLLDLRKVTPAFLESRLGSLGPFLWNLAHGIDPRPVRATRAAKSRGCERTFARDEADAPRLVQVLRDQAERLGNALVARDQRARALTLKLRYADFETVTRCRTLPVPSGDAEVFFAAAEALFREHWTRRPLRLLGISLRLAPPDAIDQLTLPL